jgi:tRNA pseudouridine(38-40) synthase
MLPAASLLRGLNGLSPKIYFTAAREVPPDFRVRKASWREYRYYLPGDRRQADRLRRIASHLPAEVDVRSFGRGFAASDPVLRPIDRLRVSFEESGVRIDIRAPSFVWGMVRKIVAGLLECEEARLPLTELIEGATGVRRLTLPLAPADGLVLWEVRYPGRWTVRYSRRTREQATHLRESRRRAEVRARMVKLL